MKKIILFTILIFLSKIVDISAQMSTMTFENAVNGSTSFTDNSYTFNIVSQAGTFRIQKNYPNTGWNGTANDNAYIDNTGTTNTPSPSFSVKSGSSFKVSKFWVFLSNTALNQSTSSGTLIITGKLNGITKFSTTKTSGFNTTFNATTGTTGVYNGFTPIDLTNLNNLNYSNIIIDEIQLQSTGGYVYMCLDAFTWSKTPTLGTAEITSQKKTSVYPNPSSGVFNLNLEKNSKVTLYDQSGKLVKSTEAAKGENKIDITELPDGIYLMRSESESYKIIKKN
ncbi:T9SS type A sorting domain-containing protein [Chryseobacterium jejuense]|uniref:Por secretion system C-terminal sorting domain n=1 Tax=Chryseobacterium jejuense TaxID=445960 RepID=A0A2X2VLU8_CHRJE|nr:T9SS type A sorting domain-containing protein [Chryseobacterium jejuense]SDJ08044.1 Por secretion system C-terminal sorting domain-containing protein [Chryseobacterium jejuense]SQB27807.1 Por secretion system C-terminal sorting domain [Chryseobacterium jejuense]